MQFISEVISNFTIRDVMDAVVIIIIAAIVITIAHMGRKNAKR